MWLNNEQVRHTAAPIDTDRNVKQPNSQLRCLAQEDSGTPTFKPPSSAGVCAEVYDGGSRTDRVERTGRLPCVGLQQARQRRPRSTAL